MQTPRTSAHSDVHGVCFHGRPHLHAGIGTPPKADFQSNPHAAQQKGCPSRPKPGEHAAMNSAVKKISLVVKVLILAACCALLMPAHAPLRGKGQPPIFHAASFMLASSGIVTPVSNFKSFSPAEGTSFRSPGKRQQKTNSPSGRADSPAALPLLAKIPAYILCARECFAASFPPNSHGRVSWHALAPPASKSA